jgi:hypothetical protein
MAITNAQQYKQLLAKGGRIGLKGGADAATVGFDKSYDRANPRGPDAPRSVDISPSGNVTTSSDRPDPVERPGNRYDTNVEDLLPGDEVDLQVDLDPKDPRRIKDENKNLFITKPANYPKFTPSYLQIAANFNREPNRRFFYERVLKNNAAGLNYTDLEAAYDEYMQGRMSGETDAMGNLIPDTLKGDRDENNYIPPIIPEGGEGGGGGDDQEPFIPNYRLMADGGMTNDAPAYEGGIMDLESGRQQYFLGKLVKKASRAIKKIAKSPIGKAALLAGGAGLFGFGPAKGLAGSKFGLGLKDFMSFGNVDKAFDIGSKSFKLGDMLSSPLARIGIPSVLAYLTPEEDDKDEELYPGADIDDPKKIMANAAAGKFDYLNYRNAADGGLMRLNYQEGGDAEPVAKKTMPLLDMDGQEMDLREEGGFVPLGRMERADDVPARLSKNEFVFTADAVRNAGEGDVDKGAEVMYNMMKNLESGGEVSEESQGLEGAREMFQTSQRLEEVI